MTAGRRASTKRFRRAFAGVVVLGVVAASFPDAAAANLVRVPKISVLGPGGAGFFLAGPMELTGAGIPFPVQASASRSTFSPLAVGEKLDVEHFEAAVALALAAGGKAGHSPEKTSDLTVAPATLFGMAHARAAVERAVHFARSWGAHDDDVHAQFAVENGSLRYLAHPSRFEPSEDLAMPVDLAHVAALRGSILVGLGLAAIEFTGGGVTGALALCADALHLAGDRALDTAALFAMWLARRRPTARQTYGWLKAEAVFSLFGAVALAGMGMRMIPDAVSMFVHPAPVHGLGVLGFAALSVVSNLISAAMLSRHHDGPLGLRGAFLHALADMLGTMGVMGAALANLLWGWSWPMPVATAAMVAMVLRVSWELGRPAWDILLDAVPAGVDIHRLASDLRTIPGVADVNDLHVRALNSQTAELVAKLRAQEGSDHSAILSTANTFLKERYGIAHSTIQIEP